MRIQHNIAAMNSHRNYMGNNSALNKNLEKLSSGYRINRAGDDAAGLAISEKMRAQITGLTTAKKNASDGISLVKTAEGALTEVHSMLNRMGELADQSANGTYDNETDRANLQKEFSALSTEIDRIADASNFNGINLLDGSLSAKGKAGMEAKAAVDLSKLNQDIALNDSKIDAVKGVYSTGHPIGAATGVATMTAEDSITIELKFTDKDGKEQTITKTLRAAASAGGGIILDDGTETGKTLKAVGASSTAITNAELKLAMQEALEADSVFKANFTMASTAATSGFSFTSRAGGDAGAVLKDVKVTSYNASTDATTNYDRNVSVTTKAANATSGYSMNNAKVWDGKASTLEDSVMEINGKKFLFVASGVSLSDKQLKMMEDEGVNHWVKTTGATAAAAGSVPARNSVAAADIKEMVEKIKKETGLEVKQGALNASGAFVTGTGTADLLLVFGDGTATTGKDSGEGGLSLRIGDTSDDFNQLKVQISDMHAKALGLSDVGIADQESAKVAADAIKAAINSVSSTRGDLGAFQNRLEHTINNLSVMTENIQDAEASIRDVDMAAEMMSYTKNNILSQSSQAMLAQANQMPQGVLQLLQ